MKKGNISASNGSNLIPFNVKVHSHQFRNIDEMSDEAGKNTLSNGYNIFFSRSR